MKKHNILIKTLILFTVINIFFGMLSGCYDRREIDDLSFVIAVGLDKGTTNTLKMTIQIAVPLASSGGSGEEGGGGDANKSSIFTSIQTQTIYGAYNMINTYISKQISMAHCKLLVFSEELAKDGIEKYIQAYKRGKEYRDTMMVVIARGSSEEFIKNSSSQLEINPANSYEIGLGSHDYTGFSANSTLLNFYLHEKCTCVQPVAILGGVNNFDEMGQEGLTNSTYKEKGRKGPFEGDYKAGDMPRTGGTKSETIGLAVFDGGKMVGSLDGQETIYYLMLTGNYGRSNINIDDPNNEEEFIILDVSQGRKPKNKVSMQGDKPIISADIKLEADILSIQSGINYESSENISILEEHMESFFKEEILRFLYRTSEGFNSDICGFGKSMKMKFLTWDKWVDFQWLSKYNKSEFDISVDVKIRRPGLMIRTTPSFGSKGEGNRGEVIKQ